MRRSRLAVAAAVVLLLTLGGPTGAAFADPSDGGSSLSGVAIKRDGDAISNGIYCSGWGNPEPQVGGNSLHYGGKIICNTVGTIWFKVQLYQIINGDVYPDIAREMVGVGSSLGGTWTLPCLGNTSTQWTMGLWATFNGIQFYPYPGVTAPRTLPCE